MTAHGHIAASKHYGCHNRPRPTAETSYVAQTAVEIIRDGFGAPCRIPIYVDIHHVMSTTCQYDKSAVDQRCGGCEHGKSDTKSVLPPG